MEEQNHPFQYIALYCHMILFCIIIAPADQTVFKVDEKLQPSTEYDLQSLDLV